MTSNTANTADASSRWSAELTDSLRAAETPRDVFQSAMLCVADEFATEGFRWIKSRKALERRGGTGRREQLTFQPNRRNRVDGVTHQFAATNLCVQDEQLGDWRESNHPRTVVRPDSQNGTVCATSCYDLHRVGFEAVVLLGQPAKRIAQLSAFCDQIRDHVLPWFRSTRDPKQLVDAVPEALLKPSEFALDLVEFLVVHGERQEARRLVQRVLTLYPDKRDAFDRGRALARTGVSGRPNWHTPEALGWGSAILELS